MITSPRNLSVFHYLTTLLYVIYGPADPAGNSSNSRRQSACGKIHQNKCINYLQLVDKNSDAFNQNEHVIFVYAKNKRKTLIKEEART